MQLERSAQLERLLDDFSAYFDIDSETQPAGFAALASFHSRSERYVLVKSAQLWAAEAHEYIFFASEEHLGLSEWQSLRDLTLSEGLARVKPHREHMYTYISLVILADTIDAEAQREIRRCHFHKKFLFALHGWTDLRVAAIECSTGLQLTNRPGKPLLKTLQRVSR